MRLWCGNGTRHGWFFLRQFSDCYLHGALDWYPRDAFVLVDPAVSGERLCIFLARVLKFLFTRFGTRLFIRVAARRRADHGQHNDAEKREKENDAKPCRKRGARVRNLAK